MIPASYEFPLKMKIDSKQNNMTFWRVIELLEIGWSKLRTSTLEYGSRIQ